MLAIMRDDPLGQNAQLIGRCVEDENHFVQMETGFGGVRMVDWLTGEQRLEFADNPYIPEYIDGSAGSIYLSMVNEGDMF